MKLRDLKGLFETRDIELIKINDMEEDAVEFNFSTKNVSTWRPGEHGAFTLPGRGVKGKRFRGFSIASVPEEGVLKIATRIGKEPSSFKHILRNLNPGETVRLRGPFGWFTLQDEISPIVLVAAGIGIAPIRALFRELEKGNERSVILIYSAKEKHIYKNLISNIAENDKHIKTHFVHTKEESIIILNKTVAEFGNKAYYYISGTPKMIKDTRKKLKSAKIKAARIITDPFYGY